jgi:hypothetical protein
MSFHPTLLAMIALLIALALASPAQAYLDPATGSMIISALVGLLAAIALALKVFWYRVVDLVRGPRRRAPEAPPDGPASTGR